MQKIIKIVHPRLIISFLVITLFSYSQLSNAATNNAGIVISSTGPLTAIQNGKTRSLSRGTSFYASERIQTGEVTTAILRFTDGTISTLRPNSTMRVRGYAYNKKAPSPANSHYSINLIQGGLRTLSGQIAKIAPNNYKLDTKAATVGVRGTDFSMRYDAKNGLLAAIFQGQIDVSNQAGSIVIGGNSPYRYAYVANQNTAPVGLTTAPKNLQQVVKQIQPVTPITPPAPVATPGPISGTISGFFLGADISGDSVYYTVDGANSLYLKTRPSPSPASWFVDKINSSETSSTDLGSLGVNGDIFAGYGLVFSDGFTLSGQVFASILSLNTHFSNSTSPNPFFHECSDIYVDSTHTAGNIKAKYTLGAGINPGFMISHSTNLYAIIDYLSTKFDVSDGGFLIIHESIGSSPGDNTTFRVPFGTITGSPFSTSKNLSGIGLGVGIGTKISPSFGVFLQYRYDIYSKINVNTAAVVTDDSAGGGSGNFITLEGNASYRPQIQTIGAGITWFIP